MDELEIFCTEKLPGSIISAADHGFHIHHRYESYVVNDTAVVCRCVGVQQDEVSTGDGSLMTFFRPRKISLIKPYS